MSHTNPGARSATGIQGLDAILAGGLPRGEIHLVQGSAGAGKTTMGLQFLLEAAAAGEKALFITFAQTEAALRKIAASHGWPLDGIDVQELTGEDAVHDQDQTLFHTADVELGEMTGNIFATIARLRPDRVVFDSMTSLRLLAGDPLRYRRQLLTMRQFLSNCPGTVLLLDGEEPDAALEDTAHGVIRLERQAPEYGDVRRRLSIAKMRGMGFHGGFHNFRIRTGGLDVFPRIRPDAARHPATPEVMTSGVAGLDSLLNGGLEEGTACLIVGPTGTGKTSVATLYAFQAARRGKPVALFCFDERPETFLARSEGLGMGLRQLVEDGLIRIKPVSTAELSPGEFSQLVRDAVETDGAKVVLLDSLTGYFHSMPQEEALLAQMHDLLAFLSNSGVLSILIVSQHGLIGQGIQGPLDVSYMADTVILLRHFEAGGAVRKAISVIKKRSGPHETTIRELTLAPGGITVGEPIRDFSGVLSGMPTFQGNVRR